MKENHTPRERLEYMQNIEQKNWNSAGLKHQKPVIWNEIWFDSLEKLRGHLLMAYASSVTKCIKSKKPPRGHVPRFATEDDISRHVPIIKK